MQNHPRLQAHVDRIVRSMRDANGRIVEDGAIRHDVIRHDAVSRGDAEAAKARAEADVTSMWRTSQERGREAAAASAKAALPGADEIALAAGTTNAAHRAHDAREQAQEARGQAHDALRDMWKGAGR